MTTIRIASPDALPGAAAEFAALMGGRTVFAFYGAMGAGKTTFIRALAQCLGSRDVVTSPTFAIVNEYATPQGPLFHFDFYRIRRLEEAYDIGYEDYFYSGRPCFVEWPELIEELLPDDCVRVTIAEEADGSRTLTVE